MSDRRRTRRRFFAAVEGMWTAAFRITGRLRPSTVRHWDSPGGQRVMVIAPHPDDEILGCGGTLLRHRDRGDRLAVVCVTDGRGLPDTRSDADAYARCRREEMERAAVVLGVERLEWLGLPEWRWEPAVLPPLLADALAAWPPDVLYLPSRVDYHPEHRKVAYGAALALRSGAGSIIRVYQVQVPLTSVLVNLISDTSSVGADLARALDGYASQRATVRSCLRLQRYAAGYHQRRETVEEFWEMPADAYLDLHREPPERWFPSTFRGLRQLALSDPAAYLTGRRARRALAAVEAGRETVVG